MATATRPAKVSDAQFSQMAADLRLLADPVRLKILSLLATAGEIHVSGLAAEVGLTQPAISHHLALLRVSGVVEPRRDGKKIFYSLTVRGRRAWKAAAEIGE
jgi:ArsR family transcriptional regulator